MHRLATRFLSLTLLATVLVGAAGFARAQTPEQLEALVQLYVPHPQGLLQQLDVAENLFDAGNIAASRHVFETLELAIVNRVGPGPNGISSSTAETLLVFTDSIIGALDAGPTDWWCDYDGDQYTVYWGVSYFAPNPYCYNDPLLGPDNDDNNPNVPGAGLQHWWRNCDGDSTWVDMGMAYTCPCPPGAGSCIWAANPVDPGFCPDTDDTDPTIGCD
jgi:hypothetical protein